VNSPADPPVTCQFWIALTDRQAREIFGPHKGRRGETTARHITSLGSSLGLGLTAGLYLFGNVPDRRNAIKAFNAAWKAGLATGLLKELSGRERPYQSDGRSRFHGPRKGHDSFPSGHTSAAFALATVLRDRYPHQEWACDSLAVLVGWSRIRKDCHFLSDVIAGAAIGRQAGLRALSR